MTNYVLNGQSWAGPTVTWYFAGSSGFYTEISEAFDRWDAAIDLDFKLVSSAALADIVLDFSYIDGPYDTLGRANSVWSLPSNLYTGETTIIFDTAETWSWSSAAGSYVLGSGVTFYSVAAHEIGHAIGLGHTTNTNTLMYPTASSSVPDLTLWDIEGGQAIYGAEAAVSGPDLNANDVWVSNTTVAAGSTVTVTFDINNIGTGNSGFFETGVYLSTNATITTSDTLLDGRVNLQLNSGEFYNDLSIDVIIPAGLAPGTYYIGAVADDTFVVSEDNENNNYSDFYGDIVAVTVYDPGATPSLSTLFSTNPDIAGGLSAAYQILLGGVPNQAGFTALINAATSTNFGAGPGVVFNSENIFINLFNNLVQGNTAASNEFFAIAGTGFLSEQITNLYNAFVPAASRTAGGLDFFNRPDANTFYAAAAAERGITSADGPAIIAAAAILKVLVTENTFGIGNSINDLINAVINGTSALPVSGTALTDIEVADGIAFDSDDTTAATASSINAIVVEMNEDQFQYLDILDPAPFIENADFQTNLTGVANGGEASSDAFYM